MTFGKDYDALMPVYVPQGYLVMSLSKKFSQSNQKYLLIPSAGGISVQAVISGSVPVFSLQETFLRMEGKKSLDLVVASHVHDVVDAVRLYVVEKHPIVGLNFGYDDLCVIMKSMGERFDLQKMKSVPVSARQPIAAAWDFFQHMRYE